MPTMVFEIIAVLILSDSLIAALYSFTKLGDTTIEQHWFMRRYLPLTKVWAVVYVALAAYITYLTFFVLQPLA